MVPFVSFFMWCGSIEGVIPVTRWLKNPSVYNWKYKTLSMVHIFLNMVYKLETDFVDRLEVFT